MAQKPRHILLADDDPDDIELFREALKEVTHDVVLTTTDNGARVLGMLSLLKPDLIFLDINMPVMNGMDCLSKIRQMPEHSDVPVVIYSTAADDKFIRKTFQLGANRYLKKPNSFEVIKSCLEEILQMPANALLQPQHPGDFYVSNC